MPATRNFLQPGLDVTHQSCVSLGDLQQMFLASFPTAPDIGYVIVSTTDPDVVAHPELARFLLLKSGSVYYYDGAKWVPLKLGLSSVLNENIKNGAVTIEKLGVGDGQPEQLIQVDPDGDKFRFVNFSTLLGDLEPGTIKPATVNSFLVTENAVSKWLSFDDFLAVYAQFWNIFVSQILTTNSQPGQIISANGVSGWKWAEDVLRPNQTLTNRLRFPADSAGKAIKVNSNATDFDYVSTTSANTPLGTHAMLGLGETWEIPHNLNRVPNSVRWLAKCNTADNATPGVSCMWPAGDSTEIWSFQHADGVSPAFNVWSNSTKVGIVRNYREGSGSPLFLFVRSLTPAEVDEGVVDLTKWQLEVYVT